MTNNRFAGRKNIFSKIAGVSAFAFLTIITSAAVMVANTDFSGTWKLNESKSNLGQFGRAAKKLTIKGNVENIAIDRASTNQAGEEVTTSEKLTVKSTIAFERNGETMEIKTTEVWSLSDDGKTLTIESESTSSRGTNTTKLVYDKAG
jgi:hypothetical protein